MENTRLLKQMEFILEIDKLKEIFRQNIVTGSGRNENDAEHSWHLAVMAILLSEHTVQSVDVLKVLKMVLIHDLVEIDAGDTFCYDAKGYEDKEERELKAAERLLNILPEDQAGEMMNLWREFEDMRTPEARYAACLDRLQPLLLNYYTHGHTWQKPGVTSEKVYKRNGVAREIAPSLWDYACKIIEDSIKQGILKE